MSALFISVDSLERDNCEYLSKTFLTKNKLGTGAFGYVNEICKIGSNECFAVKIIVYSKEKYEMSGMDSLSEDSIKNEWRNEIKILKKLNNCQDSLGYKFVPVLYDSCKHRNQIGLYFLY